jgi:hypothetical protein
MGKLHVVDGITCVPFVGREVQFVEQGLSLALNGVV